MTHLDACLGAAQVSVRFVSVQDCFGSPTRRIRVASQVLPLRSQLSQSCCLSLVLTKSSRVYLFFPPRGHKPPSTFYDSTHTFASNAVASQSPAMPNTWMSLCTQSVYSFSFPPRPFRTALSMFLNVIRFGNRPPLIRISDPAHKSLLVRSVVRTPGYLKGTVVRGPPMVWCGVWTR